VKKQTGSGNLKKTKGRQERDKAMVAKLTGFFKDVHCLVDPEEAVPREMERETEQDFRRVRVNIDVYELRREERSAEIEIDKVKRTKDSIFGDDIVEDTIKGGERSGVGRGRARGGRGSTTSP
jgi:hypothetical protein